MVLNTKNMTDTAPSCNGATLRVAMVEPVTGRFRPGGQATNRHDSNTVTQSTGSHRDRAVS